MQNQTKLCSVVVVAHKFLPQPDDDLVLFLNEQRTEQVLHIYHSFSDAPERKSYAIWYKTGKEFRRFETRDYQQFPEVCIYFKEMLFTWWTVLRTRIRWERYIGMDGLCILWGNGLRSLGLVRKTVYWAIDFVPEKRFSSRLKNKMYHWVNLSGYRRSDEMWDLSPRMAEAREKYLGTSSTTYRDHRIVPYGMWLDRIGVFSYETCERNTLVFMGHLLEKQGVQLIIDALPQLIARIPDFSFKIIGTGSFREALEALAKEKGVLKYCDFRGKIADTRELEHEIAVSSVAIAPYVRSLDTWTYYADPGKVKTYLGCGVPVILTDIPWNAREIQAKGCGIIVTENKEDIVEKIIFLLQPENNKVYRKNAQEYAQSFDYKNIFKRALL